MVFRSYLAFFLLIGVHSIKVNVNSFDRLSVRLFTFIDFYCDNIMILLFMPTYF